MKRYDVVALGELLIDFTENGSSDQGNPVFEANPGGAPCNVLAMLGKLGKRTAFIGKVGADAFGKTLRQTCGTSASAKNRSGGLAEPPQAPGTLSTLSRNSRERPRTTV